MSESMISGHAKLAQNSVIEQTNMMKREAMFPWHRIGLIQVMEGLMDEIAVIDSYKRILNTTAYES